MALAVADRVRETTTTTGTGTVTLAGAVTGYQSFSAIGNGNTTYYTINAGSQWEVGIGTYTAAGTTLSRDTVLASSNAGALVNFSAGTKDVFATYPAGKAVYQDASGNVGIGTTPTARLDVFASAGGEILFRNSGGTGRLFADGSATYVGSASNHPLIFNTNATERVRITSAGNVGIGTASPSSKLTVLNGDIEISTAAAGNTLLSFNGTTASLTVNSSSAPLVFGTSSTERMRIDSSGNLMVGGSTVFGKVSVQGNTNADLDVWVRNDNAGSASRAGIVLNASGNSWRMGMGSSANNSNALTWNVDIGGANTERMRIDSSGNLGIGTSSPGEKLQVVGSIRVNTTGTIFSNTYSAGNTQTWFVNNSSSSDTYLTSDGAQRYRLLTGAGFTWETAVSGTLGASVSWTERMRLDNSGNVGIGTSSPSNKFVVSNAGANGFEFNTTDNVFQTYNRSGAAYVDFNCYSLNHRIFTGTSPTERARIDSSGNLNIGQTGSALQSGGTGITLYGSTASEIKFLNSTTGATATDGTALVVSGSDFIVNNREAGAITFGTSNTERFRITSTGGITSSDLADAVGYKGFPQNSQTAGYTLALSDMGKHISITTGNITIPANVSVAFPVGAAVTIFNDSGSTQTISITTDTLRQAGTANTGTRTLAAYGVATVLKVASTTWVVSGNVT